MCHRIRKSFFCYFAGFSLHETKVFFSLLGSYDSVDVASFTKDEVVERLKQHNLFKADRSLKQLKECLATTLRAKHPIHSYVESLTFDQLKVIWKNFHFKGKFQMRAKSQIVNFFLGQYPKKPLQTLMSSFLRIENLN